MRVLETGRSPRLGGGVGGRWLGRGTGGPALPHGSSGTHSVLVLERAAAPTLRSCKGVINPPRDGVITLMDTGLVEHFISTRAFLHVSSSLYATSNVPQTPPPPLSRNIVPISNPTHTRGKESISGEKRSVSGMRWVRPSHL